MFFVTTKHPDYVLFAMTPSERAAVGVTETQEVHLLSRSPEGAGWQVIAKWNGQEFSHTDFMAAWHYRDEPSEPARPLDVLPAPLREAVVRSLFH
ncbi:hypothetical protein HRbin30_02703 [bacterium HR30]|nr:hypothetical protein HRbin30_02703 [bacterium HR30]